MRDLALIPGLNNTHAVFDGVVNALPANVRAHALDCPTLTDLDAIAQALLAQLPSRFWLAGFSFGGYVALAMLALAPQRISGIALICSSPAGDTDAQSVARQAAIEKCRQGHYPQMIEAQAALAFHPSSLADAELMGRRQAMVAAYGVERFMAHQQASLRRPDRRHLLDGSLPTLIVAASDDKLFPTENLRGLAKSIPGCQFQTVEQAGHLMPMEQPACLADILAGWLQETPSSHLPAHP